MEKKVGKSIAIASGKGGMGKTVLAACLGTLASENGKDVLLVDMDFGVKGLTFLFAAAEYWDAKDGSMSDIFSMERTPAAVVDGAKRCNALKVVPSDVEFHRKIDWDSYFPNHERTEKLIETFLCTVLNKFDFVVFDTGAGINRMLLALASSVDEVLVVIEPDEISLTSALDLRGELLAAVEDGNKIHFVVNRSPDVSSRMGYAQLASISFLSPLPFDPRFHSRFVKNARVLAWSGFKNTRYKRYVGRIANRLFGIRCKTPTFLDFLMTKRISRAIILFFGYGLAFLLALWIATLGVVLMVQGRL